jgi:hypothetical protein
MIILNDIGVCVFLFITLLLFTQVIADIVASSHVFQIALLGASKGTVCAGSTILSLETSSVLYLVPYLSNTEAN